MSCKLFVTILLARKVPNFYVKTFKLLRIIQLLLPYKIMLNDIYQIFP